MHPIWLLVYCLWAIIGEASAQEPSDIFRVSSECADRKGKAQMCHPPFISAAADRRVHSTNTCGERMRQKYCIHMSNSGMTSRCQYCDSRNPSESHCTEYMTDKNPNNWWQSETMADNSQLHFKDSVNLTIDLGTQFHVNYVYLQFRSPRPHAMVIYKKFNDTTDWTPWAYFSSNCFTYFGMIYNPVPRFTRPEEVICREEYSTLQPLYEGEVIFSVINGRPNYERFFEDIDLQRWSTASQIKIELKKMHTFGDERGAEKDTLLTYYFAVQKFTVGGRCLCNGHGNECRPFSGPRQRDRLVCVCAPSHHTTGDNCEQCAPDHRDVPWLPATPENPNPCRACKCNGNSQLCEFDADLYDRTGSGSRCIGCGNNTEGTNCERCKHGFFPDPIQPRRCTPCSCDPVGTKNSQEDCAVTGQCQCKFGVGGPRCDRCLEDHFGFGAGGCQPCNCNTAGGLEGRAVCNSVTGQCTCKPNVAGRQCDKCKLGHYGLMANDPIGCKPCNCSRHSSDCELDTDSLSIAAGQPGIEVDLSTLVEPDKAVINCPPGQQPCSVCLYQDRQHMRVGCDATSEGYLPCLCQIDPNLCQYCPSGWRTAQIDPRTEICKCPLPYIGNSCEQCAIGYRRDPPSGLVTDRCVACTCNGHSKECHPETGQCECEDNTGGLFCDRCADGYYGNALAPVGSTDACKICPCPEKAKCEQVYWSGRDVKVVCTDCPDNRAGSRCERCAENYYGDPLNGIPCEPCDCSNNVDPREFGNCNKTTGVCLKCLFGTTGEHCEKCLPGYRRNFKPDNGTSSSSATTAAITLARGCSPCYCNPLGTLATYVLKGIDVCNPQTGQCNCKPGVGGLRCEACNPGFYGFHTGQGCKPCDCHSIGAAGESCNDRTGVCICRPNVIGRKCDQCSPGHFNLTSTHGCQSCRCNPDGSVSKYCDAQGKCKCKPVAIGDKCDQCQENHHDLKRGCLPCPACYNLVQARVEKLRAILHSLFGGSMDQTGGSKPSGSLPPRPSTPNGKDLYAEMGSLNATIVQLYERVLKIGANTTVVDEEQMFRTVDALANQAKKIHQSVKLLQNQPSKCPTKKLDADFEKLQEEIDSHLPTFLDEDMKQGLDKLKKAMESSANDAELTQAANEITELAKNLAKQSEHIQITSKNITWLTGNATVKVNEAKDAVEESNKLLETTQQRNDTLATNDEQLNKQQKEFTNDLQTAEYDLYQAKLAADQIQDLTADVIQLQGVMNRWAEARNTSIELEQQLNETREEQEQLMNQFKRITSQLQKALKERQNKVSQLEPQLQLLDKLLNRVELAQTISWRAMAEAQVKLEHLKNFKDYIEETKKRVPEAMDKREELEARLKQVESSVQGSHEQAKKELNAAERLKNSTLELQSVIDEVKQLFKKAQESYQAKRAHLDEMKSHHDLKVVNEVSKAVMNVKKVKEETTTLVNTIDESEQDVSRMKADTQSMMERMHNLKNQLTESNGGGSGPPINDEDPTTRFKRLKNIWTEMQLKERLEHLRQLNESRSNEIAFLRTDLEEFKAHYEHLKKVHELLPSRDKGCFYTGKEIEGDIQFKL